VILAAGLSPAWQQVVVLDAYREGEVNRAREVVWTSGGKSLNAAIAAHHLGGASETRALTVLGGRYRAAIEDDFADLGIELRVVATATPTRVCTTIVERSTSTSALPCMARATELVENQGALNAAELEAFADAFADEGAGAEIALLSGSLPRGASPTYYLELLERFDGRAVLDVRGEELLRALASRPFLVKPNRVELGSTLGRELRSDAEVLAAMESLVDSGADWVVVTHGGEDVLVASRRGRWRLPPPRVEPVSSIGCGDCLSGGIAWALDCGAEPLDAVRTGMAAAADNLTRPTMGRLDPAAVEDLRARIEPTPC